MDTLILLTDTATTALAPLVPANIDIDPNDSATCAATTIRNRRDE